MSTAEDTTEIFTGVNVVELVGGIAGPIVGRTLADFGADVVKVEPPEGDPARQLPGFHAWNRGKRSIVVDPRTGTHRVEELLDGADVCIVHNAYGETPFGANLEAARIRNPGLIVVSLPPYEEETPWFGQIESEGLLSAATGVALRQSSTDGGPVESVTPVILHAQGLWGSTCAVAALIERQRSDYGQVVTVSGVHAIAYVAAPGSLTKDPTQPEQESAVGSGGPNPFYSRYQAGDGLWVFAGALVHAVQLRYLEVLGLTSLLEDSRSGGSTQSMIVPNNRDWVRTQFTEAYALRSRDEWLSLFDSADVPCGPLLTRDEWIDHPQSRAVGLSVEVEDPEHGTMSMPGVSINASRTPGSVRTHAPRLGEHEHTFTVWPARSRPSGAPPAKEGPLEGFRIVDLGTYLAGPLAGLLLSELGADVFKVETLAGDPFRVPGFTYNRGMRSLALDLRNPDGQATLHHIVRSADAVLDNGRLGVMKRLGADYDTLSIAKADIVTSSVTGFGEKGPLAPRPALDLVLQAMSGLMLAQGGHDDPVVFTISINDMTAGILCALGACLGLFERERSGRGQRVSTSLAAAAVCVQGGDFVRYPGSASPPSGGCDFRGNDPRNRYIAVADGWVRIEAPLAVDLGLVSPGVLGGLTRRAATRRLLALGVPATEVRSFAECRNDEGLAAREFTHTFKRSDGSVYTTAGRFASFGRTQLHRQLLCPGIGEHSRQILGESGLSEEEIERLLSSGVVLQGQPMDPVIFNYR